MVEDSAGEPDPYMPVNYTGLSLLSSVRKVFSGFINHCIVDYCESSNTYENEINGFKHNIKDLVKMCRGKQLCYRLD